MSTMEGEVQECAGAGPGRRKRPPASSTPPPPLRAYPVCSGSSSGLSISLPLGASEVGSVYEEVTGCEQVLTAGGTFPT